MSKPKKSYTWTDFQDVVEHASNLVLVGGQACLFYQHQYRVNEKGVSTSKDIDFYGTKAQATAFSKNVRGTFNKTPVKGGMLGLVIGEITLPDGRPVEILGSVNGLNASDMNRSVIMHRSGDRQIRILHPVALYESKLSNLRSIPQQNRNDLEHCQIMQEVVTRYLIEQMRDPTKAKNFIYSAERLFDLQRSPLKDCCEDHDLIEPWDLVPAGEVPHAGLEKWLKLRKPQCDRLLKESSIP